MSEYACYRCGGNEFIESVDQRDREDLLLCCHGCGWSYYESQLHYNLEQKKEIDRLSNCLRQLWKNTDTVKELFTLFDLTQDEDDKC